MAGELREKKSPEKNNAARYRTRQRPIFSNQNVVEKLGRFVDRREGNGNSFVRLIKYNARKMHG